jgi:hypothetical protein
MGKAAIIDAITHPISTSVGMVTGTIGDNVDRHYNLTSNLLEKINEETNFNFNTKNPTFTIGGLIGGLGGDLGVRAINNAFKPYISKLPSQVKNAMMDDTIERQVRMMRNLGVLNKILQNIQP